MNEFKGPGLRKVGSHSSLSDADDHDLSRLHNRHMLGLDRQMLGLDRQRSCDERSMNELSISIRAIDSHDSLYSPGGMKSGFSTPASSCRNPFEPHPIISEAWEALRKSIVYFKGEPVGTIAAFDHASEEVLNYDRVFVRDFVPSALAFLMNGEPNIVKNFLLKTVYLKGGKRG